MGKKNDSPTIPLVVCNIPIAVSRKLFLGKKKKKRKVVIRHARHRAYE
jgi:hypothetical protein